MNKKLIILICILILSFVALIAVALQTKPINKPYTREFHNNKLNYTITYQSPWRIAEFLSLKISSTRKGVELLQDIGCSKSLEILLNEESKEAVEEDVECLENSPQKEKINKEFLNFIDSWKIENSEFIALTDLSIEEEKKLSNLQYTLFDFALENNIIAIYPTDNIFDFETEKQSEKVSRQFVYLPDGTKIYMTDIDLFEPSINKIIRHLIINIPIDRASYEALVFDTRIPKNSKEEKQFYKIFNSIKID